MKTSLYVIAIALLLTLSVAMADSQVGVVGNHLDSRMWEQLLNEGSTGAFTTGAVDIPREDISATSDMDVSPDKLLPSNVYPQDTPPQIPEPTTILLIGAGLLGFAAGKKMKK